MKNKFESVNVLMCSDVLCSSAETGICVVFIIIQNKNPRENRKSDNGQNGFPGEFLKSGGFPF